MGTDSTQPQKGPARQGTTKIERGRTMLANGCHALFAVIGDVGRNLTLPPNTTRLERGCVQSTSRSTLKGSAASSIFQQAGFAKLLRLVYDTAALRGGARLRPATSSPMNLMPASEARPILRRLHQTLSHGILADVLPLLRATPAVTQTMMKAAGLKSSGVRMRFGEAVHRETRPALNGEFQIARRAEQMQMIRHQQAIAHQPGGGRVPPEVMERALNGCLGGPAFAFLGADGVRKIQFAPLAGGEIGADRQVCPTGMGHCQDAPVREGRIWMLRQTKLHRLGRNAGFIRQGIQSRGPAAA